MTFHQLITTALVLLPAFATRAQQLFGVVTDENGYPLSEVTITDSRQKQLRMHSDERGFFLLNVQPGDTVSASWQNKTSTFVIPARLPDSIFHVFVIERATTLEEITINAENFPRVSREKDESVFDYIAAPDGTIYLLKIKHKDYVVSRYLNDTWYEQVLEFRPERLFLDCFQNVHILTKDSAYQLNPYTPVPEVAFVISRKLFDQQIEPCVSPGQNGVFEKHLGQHNQLYKLNYRQSDNTIRLIAAVYDKQGAMVARQDYSAIIGRYLASADPEMNMILSGVWDGDVMTLGGQHFDADIVAWYKFISSAPVNVASFPQGNQVVTIDLLNDSIYVFSLDGTFTSSVPLSLKDNEAADIKFDHIKQQSYIVKQNKGIPILYAVDKESGIAREISNFRGVSLCTNIQISAGVVYFLLKNYDGMTHLYRFAREY